MSFRDNLQHLRATRNMTQEQLAMLLGVSRQSVSKWEAERAYPEMDKLLKLCDLFGCTIDDLVSGNLTDRPADVAFSMPTGKAVQDVTGYDQAMCTFAGKMSLGVLIVMLVVALSLLLSGIVFVPGVDSSQYASALVFVGFAIGFAIILPALFERTAFRKAHPFVENFYTADQKTQARSAMVTGFVVGIGFIMAGLVTTIMLQTNVWFASSSFFMFGAIGAFIGLRGALLAARCNLEKYNEKSLCGLDELQIDALADEAQQVRARHLRRRKGIYRMVMSVATVIGLLLLFVPALNAQRWFWLSWVIGGLVCGSIGAFHSVQRKTR